MYDRRSESDLAYHREPGLDQDGTGRGVPGRRTLAESWPAAPVQAKSGPAPGHDEPIGGEERADEEDLAPASDAAVAPVADQGGGGAGGDEEGGDEGDGGDDDGGEGSGVEGEEPPEEAEATAEAAQPRPEDTGPAAAQAPAGGAAQTPAGGAAQTPAGGAARTPAGGTAQPPAGGTAPGPNPAPAPAPLAANLTVTGTLLQLLDTLQLSLAGGDPGATYKFEIKRASGARWNTLQNGAASTYSGLARIAGRFKVRGTVTSGGRSQVSAEQSVQVRFPSYSRITSNATVRTATRGAWRNTLAATTAAGRREEGFWIRINTAGSGSYEVTATSTGPVVGPGTGATIVLGAKPADTPAAPRLTGSAVYTVASFHTHTPTTFRTVPRVVGPSGGDLAADQSDNVAGVVYDYVATVGNSIPAGHPLNSRARRYRSRSRRSTP